MLDNSAPISPGTEPPQQPKPSVASLIALNHIGKQYYQGEVPHNVLKNITLSITPGELIAVIGSSGSGKSTLLNILGLLDKASSGEYLLAGRNINQMSETELAKYRNQHIGFVFQQFNLLPRFTVRQNIALPLIYRGSEPQLIEDNIHQVLEKVGMSRYIDYYPLQLSGGQQQRIAIARALVGKPQIILADEPTGALDSNTGAGIMQLFSTLHAEGTTILLVTHDTHIAQQCHRQIVMQDGQIHHEPIA